MADVGRWHAKGARRPNAGPVAMRELGPPDRPDFAIDMVLCKGEGGPTSVPPPSEAEGASPAGQNLFFLM